MLVPELKSCCLTLLQIIRNTAFCISFHKAVFIPKHNKYAEHSTLPFLKKIGEGTHDRKQGKRSLLREPDKELLRHCTVVYFDKQIRELTTNLPATGVAEAEDTRDATDVHRGVGSNGLINQRRPQTEGCSSRTHMTTVDVHRGVESNGLINQRRLQPEGYTSQFRSFGAQSGRQCTFRPC